MRTLTGFCLALLLATAIQAQNQSGFVNTPGIQRSIGSAVFPAGTSAMPGVQRTVGGVVRPVTGQQIGIPGIPFANPNFTSGRPGMLPTNHGNHDGRRNNGGAISYAYPVYVPAYDNSYVGNTQGPAVPGPGQPPNVTVIYPPSQQTANPLMISVGPDGQYTATPMVDPRQMQGQTSLYQPQVEQKQEDADAIHFLIAFKDHTIYAASNYWVDGDTLHYFTSGNSHNQVSLSLVDRELTQRLNKEAGHQVTLPAAK